MKKSRVETAYQVLEASDKSMPFLDLWKRVSQEMGFSPAQFEDMIAGFYSDLSLDPRFLSLPGNLWDLRTRYASSHTNVDTDSLALEDEEDEDEEMNETEEDEEEDKNAE